MIKNPNEWKDCQHMFSNGSEHALFMETQCFNGCKRYRNGKCRIYNAIWDATVLGESAFPFSDLMDHIKYGGKICKQYTKEKQKRKRHVPKGQYSLLLEEWAVEEWAVMEKGR